MSLPKACPYCGPLEQEVRQKHYEALRQQQEHQTALEVCERRSKKQEKQIQQLKLKLHRIEVPQPGLCPQCQGSRPVPADRVAVLEAELTRMKDALAVKGERLSALQSILDDKEEDMSRLLEVQTILRQKVDSLQQRLVVQEAVETVAEAHAELQRQVTRLEEQLVEKDRLALSLGNQLADKAQALCTLEAKVREKVLALTSELSEKTAEAAKFEALAEECQRECQRLEKTFTKQIELTKKEQQRSLTICMELRDREQEQKETIDRLMAQIEEAEEKGCVSAAYLQAQVHDQAMVLKDKDRMICQLQGEKEWLLGQLRDLQVQIQGFDPSPALRRTSSTTNNLSAAAIAALHVQRRSSGGLSIHSSGPSPPVRGRAAGHVEPKPLPPWKPPYGSSAAGGK